MYMCILLVFDTTHLEESQVIFSRVQIDTYEHVYNKPKTIILAHV